MAKVVISSNEIRATSRIQEKNVTSLVVSNMDSTEATFLFNGILRRIPAFDAVYNLPVAPFEVSNDGHHFDIDLHFNSASYNLIVDYAILTPENNNENCT